MQVLIEMIKLSKVQIITALQRVLRDSARKYESAVIADCMEEKSQKTVDNDWKVVYDNQEVSGC